MRIPFIIKILLNLTFSIFLVWFIKDTYALFILIENRITKSYLIKLIIFLTYSTFLFFLFLKNLIRRVRDKTIEQQEQESLEEKVEEITNKNLINLDSNELNKLEVEIEELLEENDLETNELKERFRDIKRAYKERIHEERLRDLKEEEEYTKEHTKEIIKQRLEEEKQKKKNLEENEKQRKIDDILEELETWKNNVFIKDELNQEEINALLDEGYKYAKEYCLETKKTITVLVKPPLNHSKTHAFLVWNVKRILDQIPNIKTIKEYETKDADITFRYRDKLYAVEIETGNLLRKSKQLKQKFSFLNRKYPNRWIVLVSNKNLLSKYKKFGLTTQRKNFQKNLKKLLKSNTLKN